MSELRQLQQAIHALEALRPSMGDEVVDAALKPLRQRLVALTGKTTTTEARLKLVTILFADVIGSTYLSRQLDAEDMMAIMNGAMERFGTIIEQHDGRVMKYMGDGLMAVFGETITQEDDAERAVRAGLDLLEEAQSYARYIKRRWRLGGFDVRVGIDTGQVVLGGGVEADSSAIGMTVNLASRMESSAPPGAVRITQSTYRHVQGLFEVQSQPPLKVKGRDQPIQTYLALRANKRPFRTITRGVEGIETRMIGRESELASLQDHFKEAIQEKRARFITIVGDPGLGKSRLLYEFENWLRLRPIQVNFYKSRAILQLSKNPYNLFRFMFAYLFSIRGSDAGPIANEKLEKGLAEFLENEAQMKAHLIGALLGYDFAGSPHLMSLHDDPFQLRDRALLHLAQYFKSAARQAPTVIFLEDIHWADRPSLEALQHLARECSQLPLLFICLTRPELLEQFEGWGQERILGDTSHHWLQLKPLPENACRLLLGEILQKVEDFPEKIAGRIVSHAEGNPFYMEEIVKVLIDDGVIQKNHSGDNWSLQVQHQEHLRLPQTLSSVLQARLDSLPAAEKSVLQKAAVVGRIFWRGALEILEDGGEAVEGPLERLAGRELIYHRSDSAFSGDAEYIFKHALLWEATYNTVLKPARQRYHRQVADWLAMMTEASGRIHEHAVLIGEHYAQGGESKQAADWFIKAGKRAKDQGTHSEAYDFFNRALLLIPDESSLSRWSALVGRSEVLGILGRAEARAADDATLLTLAHEAGDDNWLAEAYYRAGYHLAISGEDQEALKSYETALASAERAGNKKLETLILGTKTISLTRLGEIEAASVAAEEALARARALGDAPTLARAITNVALFHAEIGNIGRALELLEQQVSLTRSLGDRFGESIGLNNLGYNFLILGQYQKGLEILQQSLALTAAIGAKRVSAYNRLNQALAYWRLGDGQAARTILAQAIADMAAVEDNFGQAAGYSYLAHVMESAGETDVAGQYFGEAKQALDQIGAHAYVNDALAGLARSALAQGRVETASQYCREVTAYLDEHGAKGLEFPTLAYTSCARVFQAAGELEAARTAIEAGYAELMDRAGKIDDPIWRQSLLDNVREHREIAEMAQAFLI